MTRSEALTAGELRAIDVMRTAVSEADAAEQLGLSPHTIHAYLRSARAKLNVQTTRALVIVVYARTGVSDVI